MRYEKEYKNGEYWVTAEKFAEKRERERKYAEANKEKIAERQRKYRKANKEKLAEKREANREKIAEKNRKYYEANKEEIAEWGRKYYEANKEKIAERVRKYAEANKENIAKKNRKYAEANKEKVAEWQRKYYEANKEEIAERGRKYYEANKEKFAEYQRKYREANPEIHAWRWAVSRAWKGNKTSFEIIGLTREMAKTVWREKRKIARKYFRKGELHHDHMTPLSSGETDEERRKLNHFSNFVFIPAEANLSKHDKPFWEWFAELSDVKLQRCIAEQDAYNKQIYHQLNATPSSIPIRGA